MLLQTESSVATQTQGALLTADCFLVVAAQAASRRVSAQVQGAECGLSAGDMKMY